MNYLERARAFLNNGSGMPTSAPDLAKEMEKIAQAEFERGARAQREADVALIDSDHRGATLDPSTWAVGFIRSREDNVMDDPSAAMAKRLLLVPLVEYQPVDAPETK